MPTTSNTDDNLKERRIVVFVFQGEWGQLCLGYEISTAVYSNGQNSCMLIGSLLLSITVQTIKIMSDVMCALISRGKLKSIPVLIFPLCCCKKKKLMAVFYGLYSY